MKEETTFYPVCMHVSDKSLYYYRGEDVFESIQTGATKKIPPESAKKIFVFCPDLSDCIHSYPLVGVLIKNLNMKLK